MIKLDTQFNVFKPNGDLFFTTSVHNLGEILQLYREGVGRILHVSSKFPMQLHFNDRPRFGLPYVNISPVDTDFDKLLDGFGWAAIEAGAAGILDVGAEMLPTESKKLQDARNSVDLFAYNLMNPKE